MESKSADDIEKWGDEQSSEHNVSVLVLYERILGGEGRSAFIDSHELVSPIDASVSLHASFQA